MAAEGGKRAGLTIRAVSTQGYGHAGGQLLVQAKVKATKSSRRSKIRFYISADRKRDSRDIPLAQRARVPRLKAGRLYTTAAMTVIPKTTKVGDFYYVVGCVKAKCRASRAPFKITGEPITNQALIQTDVQRGRITLAQGLLYRVYAAFGDRRLPKRYRGDGASVEGDSILEEVHAHWKTLSASARRKLLPFFLPPAARGSWYDKLRKRAKRPAGLSSATSDDPCESSQLKNPNWTNITAVGGKVRVWWWKGDEVGKQVALSVQRWVNIAYPKFKTLMGREPISDEGALCYHGPDGALDIYLVKYISNKKGGYLDWTKALTNPYPPWCSGTPVFITAQAYGGPPYFSLEIVATKFVIVHELFHAFQYAFTYQGNCDDYLWFDEGAANWAAHYVFPTDNTEHQWTSLITCHGQLNGYSYASWPFDLFLEKTIGKQTIPAIYRQFASHPPAAGVNAGIPGGFSDQLPKLTRYGWNQAPLTPSFAQWDDFHVIPEGDCQDGTPLPVERVELNGQHQNKLEVPIGGPPYQGPVPNMWHLSLASLGRAYHTLAVTDSKIRYLKFKNTLNGVKPAAVQAVVTFADGHQEKQDWTQRSEVEFCFDDQDGPSDDVTDLVVMYSNSTIVEKDDTAGRYRLRVSKQPSLTARDACESYQYKILSATLTTSAQGTPGPDLCQVFGDITTVERRKTFSLLASQPRPPVSKLTLTTINGVRYVSGQIDGKIKWTLKDSIDGCRYNQSPPPAVLPCTFTAPDQVVNPGDVQFVVNFQPWTKNTAVLKGYWSVPDPEIGVASGSYQTNCIFPYIHFTFPPAEAQASIPLYKFTNTKEQTISFSGNKHFERNEYGGYKTKLDYQWTMSVTYVRVDENGNPL
jgi:hypothetical protein